MYNFIKPKTPSSKLEKEGDRERENLLSWLKEAHKIGLEVEEFAMVELQANPTSI